MAKKYQPITFQGFDPIQELERVVRDLYKVPLDLRRGAINSAEIVFYDQLETSLNQGHVTPEQWGNAMRNMASTNPFQKLRTELQEKGGK